MERYLFVPTPNYYKGRRRKLRLIVWHSTESSEVRGGAHNVAAGWFAKASSRVSAHITADDGADTRYPSGIVESVFPWDTAWHCGNANADGYGVEIVGRAAQPGVDWNDKYSLAAIRNACEWLKWNGHVNMIPARWLTDEQLKSGQSGHVTHEQVARVIGGSTHTDPGRNFPRVFVMQCMGIALPGAGGSTANADSLPTLNRGMTNHDGVRALQRFCNAYDWTPDLPLLSIDGDYGPSTTRVVAGAQRQMGVTGSDADGTIVGPRTNRALWERGYRG